PAPAVLTPDEVRALLCVLGGSPALAGGLASEGEAWLDAVRPILHEERRDAAAHGRALDALGVGGPLPRAVLQSRLRLYCHREQLRIGGGGLPPPAPPGG